MIQVFTYKAVSKNKKYYSGEKIITHNFSPDYIIPIDQLKIDIITHTIGSLKRNYVTISEEIFNSVVHRHTVWPSYMPGYIDDDDSYLGAFIIRTADNNDILCYITNEDIGYQLHPIYYITSQQQRNNLFSVYNHEYLYRFPQYNIKCFLTHAEYLKDIEKKAKQAEKRLNKNIKEIEEVESTTIPFSLNSPKFKIISIIKDTKWVKAKVGDIIYGSLPVISMDANKPKKLLKGIGTQTNYIKIYINEEFAREVSPLVFQDLFVNNFKVEII